MSAHFQRDPLLQRNGAGGAWGIHRSSRASAGTPRGIGRYSPGSAGAPPQKLGQSCCRDARQRGQARNWRSICGTQILFCSPPPPPTRCRYKSPLSRGPSEVRSSARIFLVRVPFAPNPRRTLPCSAPSQTQPRHTHLFVGIAPLHAPKIVGLQEAADDLPSEVRVPPLLILWQ